MLVSLTEVQVDYPRRGRALGPFSLAVEAGEIVALAGPSGCGKSTALRLLAGLERPSAGRVERDVGRGETSLVFQAPTLMPWASARANVALPLELAKQSKADIGGQVDAALAGVGLSEAADAFPAQLSGGMAMRVSLARALVTEPRLLLLDEPFAALDSVTRRALIEDVHRLWAETRPAIVFVTHDVEEAAYLASRVIVMTPGPGRTAAEIEVAGPLPRPEGFRLGRGFQTTVETIADALASAMGGLVG
jgi:NitT/TauT family transport system ATP-binding protein